MATRALPVLVYDGDCGFCTAAVRLAERLPLTARIVAWQHADLAELGTTPERAAAEVLYVDREGRVHGGADAVARLLVDCGGAYALAGRLMLLPGARTLAAAIYRLVAANRSRLPGATPACELPPERRPGSAVGGQ